ncbi:MAG: FAD-dependent oxidoreductase [Candidatus Omnitrophica bacterium]|nr:FAD-dependent oxidoreductase [Candidatus Omnitrophota bacterium]
MDLPHPGAFFELCQASRQLYPSWVQQLERQSGVETHFKKTGILYLAMNLQEEQKMSRRIQWQKRRQLRVERCSALAVHRQEPAVDGKIRCGFFFPEEAQVDNVQLMRALKSVCQKSGVAIQENNQVLRILLRKSMVRGIRTEKGIFEAPVVVNCLGSWANMDGHFPIRLPVEPARGQMLAFYSSKRIFHSAIMSEQGYLVQRDDGRVIASSTIERAGFAKALTLGGIHSILLGVRRISSFLDPCFLSDMWAGFRPLTKDGLPILGPTPIDGLFVATGHFRHGILLAPITAAVLTQWILQSKPPFDLSPFLPTRFGTYS